MKYIKYLILVFTIFFITMYPKLGMSKCYNIQLITGGKFLKLEAATHKITYIAPNGIFTKEPKFHLLLTLYRDVNKTEIIFEGIVAAYIIKRYCISPDNREL